MKILGGTYKGIRIETKKDASYRPTKSRTRKSLFDMISPFNFSNVLDLYSGSGILGFECISRGASSITFIENNSQNVKLLFKNKTKFENAEILILKKNVESFFKQSKEFYDLIFADPPYGKIDYTWLFDSCIEKLSKNGKLIVEMNNNNFSYKNCIEKVYGDTKVLLFTKL